MNQVRGTSLTCDYILYLLFSFGLCEFFYNSHRVHMYLKEYDTSRSQHLIVFLFSMCFVAEKSEEQHGDCEESGTHQVLGPPLSKPQVTSSTSRSVAERRLEVLPVSVQRQLASECIALRNGCPRIGSQGLRNETENSERQRTRIVAGDDVDMVGIADNADCDSVDEPECPTTETKTRRLLPKLLMLSDE